MAFVVFIGTSYRPESGLQYIGINIDVVQLLYNQSLKISLLPSVKPSCEVALLNTVFEAVSNGMAIADSLEVPHGKERRHRPQAYKL